MNFMEIGNLVCRFGEEGVLLDFYDELVEPAFLGDYQRSYGDTRYLFLQTKLVDVGTPEEPSPAIAGRFVKDTVLHQQQRLIEGRLEPAEATLESAPSSLFVLVLKGHRLLYLREHRGSPDMSQFATTLERFIQYARSERVDRLYAEARGGTERVTKKSLLERFPKPMVTVTPVSTSESIDEFLDRFSVITALSIRLAPVNNEPDYNEFFEQWREQKDSIGAAKSKLEYRGTKQDGLNVAPAGEQLKAARDGHADFQLEGYDQNGRPLKGDNEHFKVKVPLDVDRPSVEEAAQGMASAFRNLVETDAVRAGQIDARHEATLLGVMARLGR